MSQSKQQITKTKSVLKRPDKAFESFGNNSKSSVQKLGSCSSLSKSLNNSFVQHSQESIYRNYNPNRLRINNENENNFSTIQASSSRQRELIWTFEDQSKRQQKIGQLESSNVVRSLSAVEKVKMLESKRLELEPKIKRSEMTETQKQLVQQRKKNVQLMNLLRNLENQINSKFINIVKLKKLNKEYEQVYENTQKIYTERVLVKNQFAIQCSEFLEELKDVSVSAQISVIRQNQMRYQEEQRQIEKQAQIQADEEEKMKKDIMELENKLKGIKLEVETLSYEHSQQLKKKQEIEIGYNEKMFGCMKQYRQIRILFDQISCIKKDFKTICYIANKKMKTNLVFNYEPYYKIKDKKILEIYLPDKFSSLSQSSQSQSQISSQNKFSQIQSQLKIQTFKLATLPKFNYILTNEFTPLFPDLNSKLSLELELFFKGSVYKNIKSILSQLSFNSLEYEYVFNWIQNQNNNQINSEGTDENSLGFNIFESFVDIVRKKDQNNQQGNQQNAVYPPNLILLMGDKDRGAFSCLIDNINYLLQFNNNLLSVKEIQYYLNYLDEESSEPEQLNHDELQERFELELKESLYQQTICISIILFVSQQDYNPKQQKQTSRAEGYKKQINIIFMNNQIPNKQQLAKNIIATANKEKILQQKDKLIERMEPFIRSAEKRIMITELPNLIKFNDKSIDKYNLIKDILNFNIGFETK
ncbi:hypothetical protein TTHERM_00497610 (macronuclear) [Tetrahymena thermophila SB210]|uniref:Uncharacterized protein n=1 Tax=Tetrahymena thermophila (strain SB210) TaxID=312017 RepID=I7M4N0_TETTS|nr:hypothetical protein TTHERM_00497610 [Tetrahymena thermophila SB210]EAS07707.2 hypothetical protein TTHERM_00497610 [Tetrahymena thermophila SB210]|eukprot:XP_001027949.2 hypothetical protein TTHERM_00497610 [Tetrahymena thermophila SB210]